MNQPLSSKSKDWEQKIQAQRKSGMSITRWCRQKEIPYNTFTYWKRRLKKEALSRSSFAELPDAPPLHTQNLCIECAHLRIHLNSGCSAAFVGSLVKILMEAKC